VRKSTVPRVPESVKDDEDTVAFIGRRRVESTSPVIEDQVDVRSSRDLKAHNNSSEGRVVNAALVFNKFKSPEERIVSALVTSLDVDPEELHP